MFDPEQFVTDRLRAIDASGIRRVFDLAAELKDPVNLSIGQPDFDVPAPVRQAAADAIEQGLNRYTPTQGAAPLREKLSDHLAREFPDTLAGGSTSRLNEDTELLVTAGVSGGLVLALLTTVGPGDEVLVPDPYFVMYKHLVTLAGATPVFVDTYPDFQLTADRVEAHLSERSKVILFNSPSNPTGAVASDATCRALATLAEQHNLLLISDEIYDRFCYEAPSDEGQSGPLSPPAEGERGSAASMTSEPLAENRSSTETPRPGPLPKGEGAKTPCPSPAAYSSNLLLLRGFSKSYAMTGWRLGYAAGPKPIVDQMTKLQQYSFVCAPSMVQAAGVAAMDTDLVEHVQHYQRKRDRVVEKLAPYYDLVTPGGAFYAFPKVPEHLNMTGQQFVEAAIDRGLLIIPGGVFSERDTHFRLSYACDDATLDRGLDMLVALAKGGDA